MCFSRRAEQSVSRLPRRSFSWRLFVPISPSISHISMKICVEQSESGSCTGLQGACWRGGEEIWGTVKKKKKNPPLLWEKKEANSFFFFLLPVFLTQRGSEIIPPWAPRASDDHWTLWWMDSGLKVSCCFLIKRVFLNYATGHDGKKTVQSLLFRGSKLPKWKIGDIYLEVERL